jgi:lysine biosynthesis protein LysW
MEESQNPTDDKIAIPCPECDNIIEVESESMIGDIVECSACGVENEVISLNPFRLAPLEEEK